MYTKDQQLLSEIAFALTSNNMDGAAHFADLSTGDIAFIQHEYMFEEDEITEDEINSYHDWEQDCIRTYLHHDLVHIDPIHSSESFRIMEAFADTRTNKHELQRLGCALARRHPFSEFKRAVQDLGILQEWYDFKNEAEQRQALQWLKENDLEIQDGKIRRIEHLITINPAFEPLFNERYLDNDCDTIAANIAPVLDNLEEAYKAGAREVAIRQMLQLALSNCRHFISEEHWCYFDDMYTPDYYYDTLIRLIANDINAGTLPEDLHQLLTQGLAELSATECVQDYGYLDLQEHLNRMLK